jgi:hypothetical protein
MGGPAKAGGPPDAQQKRTTHREDYTMSRLLDLDSFEGVIGKQPKRQTPIDTDPLALDGKEKAVVKDVVELIAKNLTIVSKESHLQFMTFRYAMETMQAALDKDWIRIAAAATLGLKTTYDVKRIAPFLITKNDGAARNIVSDQRIELKGIAMRLSYAKEGRDAAEADLAFCVRAATCAAIAAERGLMHIVQENLGAIVSRLSRDDCPGRRKIAWTDEMLDYSRRYRAARIKMP